MENQWFSIEFHFLFSRKTKASMHIFHDHFVIINNFELQYNIKCIILFYLNLTIYHLSHISWTIYFI